MAVVTLTWRSESQDVDLIQITARDLSAVSEKPGRLWWEVAVRHRDIAPAPAWTVAARNWLEAVNVATGLALRNAHPELASVLVLLVPDWE